MKLTNEQILEQQIEALEKLLQLKTAVIEELEAKVQKLQNLHPTLGGSIVNLPYVAAPPNSSLQCSDGQFHQYPTLFGGSSYPSCVRCGHRSQSRTYGGQIAIGGTGSAGNYGQLTVSQSVDQGHNVQSSGSNNISSVIPLNANSAKQ